MLGRPESVSATSSPGLYRGDRRTLLALVVGGDLAGGVSGLLAGHTGGLLIVGTGALLGGLGLGLVAGLALTATGWFAFARAYPAVRERLPRRLLEFLQDARRRSVLRQVGGLYQFRHARLQDRLAEVVTHPTRRD